MTEQKAPCPTCGGSVIAPRLVAREDSQKILEWAEEWKEIHLTDESIHDLKVSDAVRSLTREKIESRHLRGEITAHERDIALNDLVHLDDLRDHGVLTQREFQLLADRVGE